MRILWIICVLATLWFALIPPDWGGLGGAGYHGVAFMVLGLLTPAAFPRAGLAVIWLALINLAGGIELAQGAMSVRRHAEWSDFAIGAFAATVGIVYYRVWLFLWARIAAEEGVGEASEPSPPASEI